MQERAAGLIGRDERDRLSIGRHLRRLPSVSVVFSGGTTDSTSLGASIGARLTPMMTSAISSSAATLHATISRARLPEREGEAVLPVPPTVCGRSSRSFRTSIAL